MITANYDLTQEMLTHHSKTSCANVRLMLLLDGVFKSIRYFLTITILNSKGGNYE